MPGSFFRSLRYAAKLALNRLVKTTDRFAGERYNGSDYTFLILVWGDGNMAIYCRSPYRGSAQITREQFLFYEMRTTARLMREGLSDDEILERIVEENLFQYPTEKSIRQMAKACVNRLKAMGDEDLIEAVAAQTSDTAKQICMYAMMKQYRLVWDFMITVIGEKYRTQDFSFGQRDVNVFFMQLQEQDDYVAGWSETTVKKIRQILIRILAENEYLDNINADHINPVWLNPVLENAIRGNNDDRALVAFNCFS